MKQEHPSSGTHLHKNQFITIGIQQHVREDVVKCFLIVYAVLLDNQVSVNFSGPLRPVCIKSGSLVCDLWPNNWA